MAMAGRIGQKIRMLRERSGLKQNQLAKYLNIDQTYISKIENDDRPITSDLLEKICYLFGCTLNELLTKDISTIETLQFAFRANEVNDDALVSISDINRIALNIKTLVEWLEN